MAIAGCNAAATASPDAVARCTAAAAATHLLTIAHYTVTVATTRSNAVVINPASAVATCLCCLSPLIDTMRNCCRRPCIVILQQLPVSVAHHHQIIIVVVEYKCYWQSPAITPPDAITRYQLQLLQRRRQCFSERHHSLRINS